MRGRSLVVLLGLVVGFLVALSWEPASREAALIADPAAPLSLAAPTPRSDAESSTTDPPVAEGTADQVAIAEGDSVTAAAEVAPAPTPTVDIGNLPLNGPGTFTSAPATDWQTGESPYRTFSVAVEDGIGLDPVELAIFVEATLSDARSWIGDGQTGFERVAEGGDFRIVVASPTTVDQLCLPLNTVGIYSCGNNGYIALNLLRWMTATEDWPTDLVTYRRYLLNHEVGHYILGPNHDSCPGNGQRAPIMMQQTKGLEGCLPNAWPYP